MHYDKKLGDFVYTGLTIEGVQPIAPTDIAKRAFDVIVGGKRYGKGSSREHSPLAEKSAGIKLVIAESFERIYRQNCDNLGLFTSTDFSLIDRIKRGEDIAIEELLKGRDSLARQILISGGLLNFGQQYLSDAPDMTVMPSPPLTLAQKIIARNCVDVAGIPAEFVPGSSVFVRSDFRFIHEYYTAMAANMIEQNFAENIPLKDPQTIILFEDHLSYAHRSPTHLKLGLLPQVRILSDKHRAFGKKYGLTDHSYLPGGEGSEGISHAMMAEKYALPGALLVGTDSHTPHSGALGCFAYGVGTTDMANAFLTGISKLNLAETVLIKLQGDLPDGVMAKDVALKLLSTDFIREGKGLGKIFEFTGSVIEKMSIDERATLTNMVAEMGGLTGLCAPDEKTIDFIKERRGQIIELEDWMCSDKGAVYEDILEIDCSTLCPMLARPGDPGNGVSIADLEGEIPVDIAYGGSCTAGKRADFDQYHQVALWAMQHNMKVPEHIEFYLQCGTMEVQKYCIEKGYMPAFEYIGAEILSPSCGACGQCGPGVSSEASQVTISAINRNFPGRGGPGKTWLANPATVVASPLAGKIISFADLQKNTAGQL